MARGTTVFRIRIELIFRRCWNLVTPSRGRVGLVTPIASSKILQHGSSKGNHLGCTSNEHDPAAKPWQDALEGHQHERDGTFFL